MRSLIISFLFCIALANLQDDRDKSIKVLVREYGYKIEEHKVLTDDHYWLRVFRVYNPKFENTARPVVFL